MNSLRHSAEAVNAARSVLEDDGSGSEDSMDEADHYSDSLSSSLDDIDAADIDFEHVYALHTFLATVEGQASVSKGDNLTLLDDTNSYWWLVRVLKTQAVGYIPAENIETPFERLARLNKHRNVDLSSATQEDHATGFGSAQARTRIVPARVPDGSRSHPVQGPPGTKSVAFAAPTFYEHSDNEHDDDNDDDDEEEEEVVDESPTALQDGSYDDYSRAQPSGPQVTEINGFLGGEGYEGVPLDGGSRSVDADLSVSDVSDDEAGSVLHGSSEERSPRQFGQTLIPQILTQGPVGPYRLSADSPETRKLSLTPEIARECGPQYHRALASTLPYNAAKNDAAWSASDRAVSPEQPRGVPTAVTPSEKVNSLIGSAQTGSTVLNGETVESSRRKKSTGMFGGLFKRRDRARTDATDEDHGSSLSQRRISAPLEARAYHDGEDAYLVDATSRQQQVEARKALSSQSVFTHSQHRVDDSQLNSTSAETATLSPGAARSNASHGHPQNRPLRPGSLLGSPGGKTEVPVLNVMRVFAGDNVQVEATFKTVLLNQSTTSDDLLRQALQRFQLPIMDTHDYYLAVKNLATGSMRTLEADQQPLPLLERLNAHAVARFPSVKRSSIGSISSVSSNLSLNPAIERLGMSDYSDDSMVKVYLHARPTNLEAPQSSLTHDSVQLEGSTEDVAAALSEENLTSIAPDSIVRYFAAKFALSSRDLPNETTLDEFGGSSSPAVTSNDGSDVRDRQEREKVLLVPADATVAELIELALDRYGIIEGVVHGGDEVGDRLTSRRSVSRVPYCLFVRTGNGAETFLAPTSKVSDAYVTPPLLQQSPQAAVRRGGVRLSAGPLEGLMARDGDPVFVLRNHALWRYSQGATFFPERRPASDDIATDLTSIDHLASVPVNSANGSHSRTAQSIELQRDLRTTSPHKIPLYRFDESGDRLATMVSFQAVPAPAYKALREVVSADRDFSTWTGRSWSPEVATLTRKWYGGTLERTDVLAAQVDALILQFIAEQT